MGRKAKHHYIPKCYLKGFTEGGKDSSPFWCVPVNNSAPFKTNPNDSCAERDYYTLSHSEPLVVENWYANEVEPIISKVITHTINNSFLPSRDDREGLILFLATLYLRIPLFRKSLEIPRKCIKNLVDEVSKAVTVSNISDFDYDQKDVIFSEIKLIKTVKNCLRNNFFSCLLSEMAMLILSLQTIFFYCSIIV